MRNRKACWTLPRLGLPRLAPQAPISEKPGTVVGLYRLLEQIGEGGFGVVFLAEQERPVRRRMALKIIKPGMDTRQVIARFEAERQVLAMMDHPGIAKVFDAGTTEEGVRRVESSIGCQVSGVSEQERASFLTPDTRHLTPSIGRPYFVMELVQGVPITEYCDECNLTTSERLDLFITVCRAVNHAHEKGVIHRDLKPNNVLVAIQDGRPMAKIIDFGVAKALNERLIDHTLMTGFAQMLGTPLYMSPEQAELSPLGVDTRSDIYSLGVMLYELLVGTAPFDRERLKLASHDELRRIIREEEPPRPSERISTLAADLATTTAEQRRTDPRRLKQHLRGDLDWIVMKCLDKDRNRRYATAGALGNDILRFLHDEPIEARPPSVAYRFRKFARRHKTGLAVGIALVALAASMAMLAWQRHVATTQRLRAEQMAHDIDQRQYATDMRRAHKSWLTADIRQTVDLLERHVPRAGRLDSRGFEWHYLWQLCHGERWTLRGHTGEVYFVTFSPDGKRLATASQDGTVRLWDSQRGLELQAFRGHVGEVTGVSFSPNAEMLASAGDDQTVRLWDISAGDELAVLRGHTDTVFNAVFSPDGKLLASGGSDGLVKLWNPASGEELATLQAHSDDVEHLAFSPDGRLLATAGGEFLFHSKATAKLWDVGTRRLKATLLGHLVDLQFVAFSPDGGTLATASLDETVKLWDVSTGTEVAILHAQDGYVHGLAYSPDGKTLASASRNGIVRLWDMSTRRSRGVIRGHQGRIWSVACSPEGRTIATAGADQTVKLWEASTFRDRSRLPVRTDKEANGRLSPDGKWLATWDRDAGLLHRDWQLWNVETGALIYSSSPSDESAIWTTFSPDSRLIAVGNHAHVVISELPAMTVCFKYEVPENALGGKFSHGGRWLATSHDVFGGTIQIRDIVTGKDSVFKGHEAPVRSAGVFS